MIEPTLTEAVNEIQTALEGYTEDCISSDPAAQKALQQAWDLVRARLPGLKPLRCGERLYLDGNLHAVCTQPGGTEHSHNDLDAQQAIVAGLARPASDSDRPHATTPSQDVALADWPWQDAGLPPFAVHEVMGEDNIADARRWLDMDEMAGLVEERNGGIIGYINRAHVERIVGLLNLAGLVVENEQ